MKRLIVPSNGSRFIHTAAVKAARAAVVTHKVVKPNPAVGVLTKALKG
ncbi:MAG TPA: hypothetical protein H9903_10570 [Candidatus Aquabacterium excrementipullorum]|nr:hypothetical protein [Candidatus Aquabacterium excrementipullorum]